MHRPPKRVKAPWYGRLDDDPEGEMDAQVEKLPEHMRDFGLHLMGKAVRDATFSDMGAPYAHAMAVTIAAQAAEIIIKARIAQEHPLLIFSKLPKPDQDASDPLNVGDLLSSGRSIQFSELAGTLWACTGYRIVDLDRFHDFGATRNAIIHFAVPNVDLAELTLRFAFEVIQPMIGEFWDVQVLEYCDQYDFDMDIHLKEQLDRLGLSMPTPRPRPRRFWNPPDEV